MTETQRPDGATRSPNRVDRELAALAQAGDREAFGELVKRYSGPARRVARAILGNPEDADDAAQDGFLAALRHLGRYDPGRPFGPWLLRIVSNAATDRRRRRRVRAAEAIPAALPAGGPAPGRAVDVNAMCQALRQALATLPERQRVAVVLFDVEGYSHAEIAEVLKIPVGTVRSHVFHARRALRKALAPWRESKENGA
jgi:RNA polymerase sigma-70 factor (ECF subfamily)